jgi:MFS family permease
MNYFHPIVWQLLVGMVFARTASFMTLPFLAIYMQGELGADPILIGIAVGVAPLASTFGGFIGGYLTDRFGRKKIILLSMAGWAVAFFGFAFAHTAWLFIVLNALNGLSRAFFEPSSQALMIDYTVPDKRRRLFSIRYTFINLSAVVGPLLGVFIANLSTMTIPFIITGSLYVFCFVFFFVVLRNVEEIHTHKTTESPMQLAKVLLQDRILLLMVLGSVFASFVYSQTDSTLSQLLNNTLEDGIILFSVLIAINAFTVMLLQLPLSILTEKMPVKSSITLGSMLTIIGMFFFYLADGWTMYIIAMIFISLAEIFIWPLIGVVIEMIAPDHQKATYIGVMQFQSLGGFIGPIIGGWMLMHFAGEVYLVVTFGSIFMLVCYLLALRKEQFHTKS